MREVEKYRGEWAVWEAFSSQEWLEYRVLDSKQKIQSSCRSQRVEGLPCQNIARIRRVILIQQILGVSEIFPASNNVAKIKDWL